MRWEAWQETYWIPAAERPRNTKHVARRWRASRLRKRNAMLKKLENWNEMADQADPKFTQCSRFIKLYGGIIPFSIAVGVHPETIINNWLDFPIPGHIVTVRSKFYITSGMIPSRYLARALVVSRYWGILLKPEDLYPDFVGVEGVKNFHNNEEIMRWVRSIKSSKKMKTFEDVITHLTEKEPQLLE